MQHKLVAQLILFIFSTQIMQIKCGGQLELQLENRQPSPSSSDTNVRTNDLASFCDRRLFGGCIMKICAREFRWKLDTNAEAAIVVDKNSSIVDRQAVMRSRCKYGDGIMNFAANDAVCELIRSEYHRPADGSWVSFPICVNSSSQQNGEKPNSDSQSSVNDASQIFELRYRVQCRENFYGPNCDVRCEVNDWERKLGHFECSPIDGAKRCQENWTGQACNLSKKCDCVHGRCEPGTNKCTCDKGWQGDKCNQCKKYERCQGHCVTPWQCLCPEGRGGKNCDIDLTYCVKHEPCQNDGRCQNHENGSYSCTCTPGFTGTNCEIRMNNCDQSPCHNGGKCINSPKNPQGFRCECPTGGEIFGRFCQVRIRPKSGCTERPCQNGGSCLPTSVAISNNLPARTSYAALPLESNFPVGFQCLCAKGWIGLMCDTPSDWCSPGSCFNGGSCEENPNSELGYICHCRMGFAGTRCEWNIDDCRDNPCQNKGICVDDINGFRCKCASGFDGDLCEYAVSKSLSSTAYITSPELEHSSPNTENPTRKEYTMQTPNRDFDDWLFFSKLLLAAVGILILLVVLLLLVFVNPKRLMAKLSNRCGEETNKLPHDKSLKPQSGLDSFTHPPKQSVPLCPPKSSMPSTPPIAIKAKDSSESFYYTEERYVAEPSLRPGPEASRRLYSHLRLKQSNVADTADDPIKCRDKENAIFVSLASSCPHIPGGAQKEVELLYPIRTPECETSSLDDSSNFYEELKTQQHPCQNKGICVDDINGFRCKCASGFDGDLCEYAVSKSLSSTAYITSPELEHSSPNTENPTRKEYTMQTPNRDFDDWLFFSKLLLAAVGILILLVVLLLLVFVNPKRLMAKLSNRCGEETNKLPHDKSLKPQSGLDSFTHPPKQSVPLCPPKSSMPSTPPIAIKAKDSSESFYYTEERYVAEPSLRPGPEASRRLYSHLRLKQSNVADTADDPIKCRDKENAIFVSLASSCPHIPGGAQKEVELLYPIRTPECETSSLDDSSNFYEEL
ncbi:EGF-like domain-containing protein [Ditylenchus destructor]|uniref:EGF-like domain-containing protein n=1 Tax=Ditylenchus destructor TaxID=166010 RepID=A0AAD4NCX9_9BILA|nr:EGF-like domain-containing protein [Ditylenchus destructor]